MTWLLTISCCCLCSCTVTITAVPFRSNTRYYVHHHRSGSSTATAKTKSNTVVDSEWLQNYKEMEAQRGDFTIPQDDQIQPKGDKFRIPQAVLDHYQDMLKAKASLSP